MPFYGIGGKEIVLRAEFSTKYSSSSKERKENIRLAANSLNNFLVDSGGEFSFNRTVGERSEKRGYKNAKIILDGEFVDGVGGGVCQVSTTLYNALLLAGMTITEYHPHSLAVSYIAPSFDAMVNSNSADLRFINYTDSPVIIKTTADGTKLTVSIYGEPSNFTVERRSVITGEIVAPTEKEEFDDDGNFPDLFEGERRLIKPSKAGLTSEGFIVIKENGKIKEVKKIRKDRYNPVQGKVVIGRAIKEEILLPEEDFLGINGADGGYLIKILEKIFKI
jgi:vancomycin resistance protein YoaR